MACGRAEVSRHMATSREKQPQSVIASPEPSIRQILSGPDQVPCSVPGDAEARSRALDVLAQDGLSSQGAYQLPRESTQNMNDVI